MASIKYTYHRNLSMFRASGIWCSKNRTLLLILVTLNISMFLLMNYINQYYFNIFTILKYKYSWKFMNYDEKWILPVFKRNFRKTLIFDERVGGIFLRRWVLKLIKLPSIWYIYYDDSSCLEPSRSWCSKNRTFAYMANPWYFMVFFSHFIVYIVKLHWLHGMSHQYSGIFLNFLENVILQHFDTEFHLYQYFSKTRGRKFFCVG